MSTSPGSEDVMDIVLEARRQLRDAEREARPHSTGPTASSLGYCFQRQVRDLQDKTPRVLDGKTLRTFQIGNKVEDVMVSAYRTAGMLVMPEGDEFQWKLYDEKYNVTARLDALLCWPPEDVDNADLIERGYPQEYIESVIIPTRSLLNEFWADAPEGYTTLEVKSASSASIKRRRSEGPSFEHRMQVGTEMWIHQRNPEQLPGEILQWRIEYIGKDYAGILPFEITEDDMEEAGERIEAMDEYLKMKWQDVPCECEGWQAPWCPYITNAWAYEIENIGKRGTPIKPTKMIGATCCVGGKGSVKRLPKYDELLERFKEVSDEAATA